jgi:hypothetical protein
MRRLCTIVLVVAAAVTVTVTTSGSAYAGDATTRFVSPASHTSQNINTQDDMGGCRSHRAAVQSALP